MKATCQLKYLSQYSAVPSTSTPMLFDLRREGGLWMSTAPKKMRFGKMQSTKKEVNTAFSGQNNSSANLPIPEGSRLGKALWLQAMSVEWLRWRVWPLASLQHWPQEIFLSQSTKIITLSFIKAFSLDANYRNGVHRGSQSLLTSCSPRPERKWSW